MANEVPWNKVIYERFSELAMLNDIEKEVLETRLKGWTITEQSMKLGLSKSTIDRVIRKLKAKYDAVQKHDPEKLPPRKTSKQEKYMDEH